MSQKRKGVPPRAKAPSVVVGFCHPQESVTPQFRKCLTAVYMRDARGRAEPWIVGELDHESSGVHIPDARCAIVSAFLAHPYEPEWLWMVDADATFADDVLDRLIAAADPKERPIVGALAFGVKPRMENGVEQFNDVFACELDLFPTIYTLDEDLVFGIWMDYPRDQLVPAFSTGCHCVLVHRSVLADPAWQDGHPLPWFRTAAYAGRVMSEDQFFYAKAGALGYPTHVHTGIKTGHVKTFVADEDLYDRLRDDA